MSNDEPLIAPKNRRVRAGVRAVIESLLEGIPYLGPMIVNVSKVVRPPRSEVEDQEWQEATTHRVNAHGTAIGRFAEALDGRRIQLSAAEVALAEAISRACPNGMRRDYEIAELRDMLPSINKDEIEAAAHHLIALGVLDDESAIGHLIVRPTQQFYEQFDRQMRGWNTLDDALTLARLMLEKKEGHSSTLLELTGWEPRRLNPAQRHLIEYLPDGFISKEIQPRFATSSVAMVPQVIAALRSFIELR